MPEIILTITVDWEGWFLQPRDLNAMRALYAQLDLLQNALQAPIPITHFICPAYFTRTQVAGEIELEREKILSVLTRKQDEIGAHVHCWKSLFLESGIPDDEIKLEPVAQNFNPPPFSRKDSKSKADIGYQVPFGAYSEKEMTQVLKKTIELLQKQLSLKDPVVSFRCGCWVMCDALFRSLPDAGIKNDASAVPFNYIANVYVPSAKETDLTRWLIQIWGSKPVSAPPWLSNSLSYAQYPGGVMGMSDLQISEPAMVNGVVEVPDTAMLLPWANQALMNSHIDQAFEIAEKTGKDVYISIGFHQETCGTPSRFKPKGFDLTKQEEQVQLNGILGAVAHAVSKSLRQGVPVKFIQKSDLGDMMRARAAAGPT